MHIKFYLGLGLLIAALTGCFGIGKAVSNVEMPVSRQVEAAAEQGQNGDLSGGVAALEKAQKLWDRHRKGVAAVSDHNPMDEIDSALAETIRYGVSGLRDAFLAGCERLKLLLSSLTSDHQLTWWNLLAQTPIQ